MASHGILLVGGFHRTFGEGINFPDVQCIVETRYSVSPEGSIDCSALIVDQLGAKARARSAFEGTNGGFCKDFAADGPAVDVGVEGIDGLDGARLGGGGGGEGASCTG